MASRAILIGRRCASALLAVEASADGRPEEAREHYAAAVAAHRELAALEARDRAEAAARVEGRIVPFRALASPFDREHAEAPDYKRRAGGDSDDA